jgi:hypothetical protein
MEDNFVETIDSSGRSVIEMNDHSLGLLWLLLIMVQLGVWTLARGWREILIGEVLGVALLGLLYLVTRKHLRIVIDPARRVLTLGRRVIRLDQIVRAELSVEKRARESGPGGGSLHFYRVELLLRSGERVPTIRGHGQFAIEDCHRLMDVINIAVGAR